MAGPGTPSTEGPSFTPPPLPFGWIAQWDSSSKRYYYVQLSTGQSQWEVPTHAIPTGMTPHPVAEHPYGYPQPEIITFEDGSQSKRHADGTIEPVLPDGNPRPGDVATTESVPPSATGDRGIGSIAVNALLSQAKNSHSNSNSGGLGSLGNLAGQVIGGLSGGKTNSSNNHGNTSKLSGGKLAAQLAQGLFSSSGKTGGNSTNSHNPHNNHGSNSNGASPSSSNYHGGTTSGAPQSHGLGGLGGSILGGLVGGNKPSSNSNFGYSNTSPNTAYNGEAPANSYQTAQNSTHGTHPQSGPPPATHYHQQPSHSSNSYHSPPAAANTSYQAPPPATAAYHNTHNHNTSANPSYQGSASGSNYGSPPAVPTYNRPDSGPHSHHNSSPNHATYPGATAVGTSGASGFGGSGAQSSYHHQSQPVSHHGGGPPPQPSSSGPSPYGGAGGYTHTQPYGQPHGQPLSGQPAYGNHAPPPTQGYQHHNQYAPPPATNYGAASGYGNPHY